MHAKTQIIDRKLIEKHVETFRPSVSHYRREHAPNKRYLSSDLSIRELHKDFLKMHPSVKCSYEVYRKHVSTVMNISFVNLGHEECEHCETYKQHNLIHTQSPDEVCQICSEWSLLG